MKKHRIYMDNCCFNRPYDDQTQLKIELETKELSKRIQQTGIKNADSLHLACAISTQCSYFISTDTRILKYNTSKIIICDPVDFLRIWEVIKNDE